MALVDRIFGKKSAPAAAAPAKRVEQMVAPHRDMPRPARAHVYREATVTYDSGYVRKGIVLDFSDTGVRLRFPTNERLPDNVTLNARAVGISGPARLIWQENSEAGLSLVTR